MFLVFLFCLSFLNLMYAFLDLDVFKLYRPLHMLPFPYKWLIGPAFYLYIKYQFFNEENTFLKRIHYLLFVPAIIFGLLRMYWFIISITENSYRITSVIVNSNFFRIQEFFILLLNLTVSLLCLDRISKAQQNLTHHPKKLVSINWLRQFVLIFFLITIFQFISFIVDLIVHQGQETFQFIYPGLILNVIFIYWLGFIGFVKPKLLFNTFYRTTTNTLSINSNDLAKKLKESIDFDEVYKNPKLTLATLSVELNVSSKSLSQYINETYEMNFSEFINYHRIEKVKQLLASPNAKKYKLQSLAEEAGFTSKSSFYATFKKMVGKTPSEYLKTELNN